MATLAVPLLALPASAGPPVSGSGTGVITSLEITSVREAAGNSHQDRVVRGTVTGTLDGTFVEQASGMVHASGRVVFRGIMTFTGQVADCGHGTITLGVSGRGEVPVPGFPVTESQVRVINQASNTVAVTGSGTVRQVGPDLQYDIQYVCH